MSNTKLIGRHIILGEDGKVYEVFCAKFPNGEWDMSTQERREITDKNYIEWFKKNAKTI